MKTGALLFAFNNENTDYLELAAWSAERIRKHLCIPVAVVTNQPEKADPSFDYIIYSDSGDANARMFEDYGSKTASWHNARRTDAYELTPFDQTLVLDADYVVNSSLLAQYFDHPSDFLCYKDAFSIDQEYDQYLKDYNSFGTHKFPMWWATVMLFKKSNTSAYIFDAMNMIRQNWNHYLELYNIPSPMYRNDFALSIALGIVSGHTLAVKEFINPLPTLLPHQSLKLRDYDMWEFEWESDGRRKSSSIAGIDFHAMNKKALGEVVEAHRRARLCDTSS